MIEIREFKESEIYSAIRKGGDLINEEISQANLSISSVCNLSSELKIPTDNQEQISKLNIFRLISAVYHRENFHSDVIEAILQYENSIGERPLLKLFLAYLNQLGNKTFLIPAEYDMCKIHREKGKIDISFLVDNWKDKKAIIFENKINNAPDMPRQIPRYVDLLEKSGYCVEAVIYLVLNNTKTPSTSDWSSEDINKIQHLVCGIKAVDSDSESLVEGWLKECLKTLPNDLDICFLIKQYISLLKHLSKNTMNKELMEKFLTHVLIDDNYRNAIAVKDMINDLILYRRNKILDRYKYKKEPFTRIIEWNNYAVIDTLKYKGGDLAIDVIVEADCYRFQFFDRVYINSAEPETLSNHAAALLLKMGYEGFLPEGLRMQRIFLFPSNEFELYRFIDEFIEKIRVTIKDESE